MLKVKAGVRLSPALAMSVLIVAARDAYARRGLNCVVTSALDGQHLPGSLHYKGLALDFRTRDLGIDDAERLRDELAEALGQDFDVVLEGDHLHAEFDPKGEALIARAEA